jgi:inositol transport system ATP-binding protein
VPQVLLKTEGLSKSFRGIAALSAVDFEVAAGEVHALLGENGAGKSTLLKILSGAQPADAGSIFLSGAPQTFRSPQDAQSAGIATIYQELTLVPAMSIAENIFLGREPGRGGFVNWKALEESARQLLAKVGLAKDVFSPARDLSVAEQQLVEIARALSMNSRLIIMDEPTAALSTAEVETLFRIVRDLKASGLSVVFVTHRLEEVMRICDRYTILRDGRKVVAGIVAETTIPEIIRHMVGREVLPLGRSPEIRDDRDIVLSVERLSRRGTTVGLNAMALRNINFDLRRGEILGIAGLVGSGRTETARAIFGADEFDTGAIRIDGVCVTIGSPRDAIRHGIGLVPEDRKQQALFLALSIRENMTLTVHDQVSRFRIFMDRNAEESLVNKYRRLLKIRMADSRQMVADLSGGNQQKVVLARWLALNPKVLIVDEPTRGIDVGAKAEVHALLFEMAKAGISIIAISSELPEILTISDRIVTMHEGRVTGAIDRAEATPEVLLSMMMANEQPARQ